MTSDNSFHLICIILGFSSKSSSEPRKEKIESQTDKERIRKGIEKGRRFLHSKNLFLSVFYPFALQSFSILSRLSALELVDFRCAWWQDMRE